MYNPQKPTTVTFVDTAGEVMGGPYAVNLSAARAERLALLSRPPAYRWGGGGLATRGQHGSH